MLGILLHPDNAGLPFPLIFTGPASSENYFREVDAFIGETLGPEAQQRYTIIVGNPVRVATEMKAGIAAVREYRKQRDDAYYFNWSLRIEHEFQQPFIPTQENMSNLEMNRGLPGHTLAANLRRVFSGIVAGNVKDEGIRAIEKHGHFEIRGDADIMDPLDTLLKSFVAQHRMKLPVTEYVPCYRIIK
jgi:hypothetical protein